MNKVADFISKLVAYFPVRHESPEREIEWLGSMAAAIKHYDADVLQRAAQKIIDTRTDRRFPLVAEIRKVCGQIVSDDKANELPIESEAVRSSPWSKSRSEWADKLIESEMGRRAAREGWILGLHDFIRNNGKMPGADEIRKIQQGTSDFDDAYALCVRGAAGGANDALLKLGEKMLKRRNELADRVLHGVIQ